MTYFSIEEVVIVCFFSSCQGTINPKISVTVNKEKYIFFYPFLLDPVCDRYMWKNIVHIFFII